MKKEINYKEDKQMTELNKLFTKEAMRKTLRESGGDSIRVEFKDKEKQETLIITLHDYIDEDWKREFIIKWKHSDEN